MTKRLNVVWSGYFLIRIHLGLRDGFRVRV